MSTDALFMPPTPRLRGDKELPPCSHLMGHTQHATVPLIGGWSPGSAHQSSQGWSSTPGSVSLLVPQSVRFMDTTQYSVGGPLIAGDAHAAGWGALNPVIPQTNRVPEDRVPGSRRGASLAPRGSPHNHVPHNRIPHNRIPHNRIPHHGLDSGVGARGNHSTPSGQTRYSPYPVVPEVVIPDYERPARHAHHRAWGPSSSESYSRRNYGPGDDPFPKISFWRRVARMLFCRT